jgi:hypothetical protein
MSRTNAEAVKDILGTNYDTINCPKLTPYIRAANLVTTRANDCASDKGYILSVTELTEIEKWLAAYFYTIYDPIYKSKQTENSSATYFDRSYLDVVKALDPSGCVKAIVEGKRISFDWLGKEPSNQIDIDDRR